MATPSSDILRGTLDLLILKTLTLQPMHGWGISQRIEQFTRGVLDVNQGSLYPALQRLEQKGWIESEWGSTENNRKARYYRLTDDGRKALGTETESWRRYVSAVELGVRDQLMKLLKPIARWWKALFQRESAERDLDDEIQLHLEMETAKNVRGGMPADQARREALIAFGGIDAVKEAHRDGRGVRWLEDVVADTRFAMRTFRRNPLLAATAILTLALGIGANTAIFSVVNRVILRPLPFPSPDQLMMLAEDNPEKGWHQQVAAPANYLDWQARVPAFADVAAYDDRLSRQTLSVGEDPVLVSRANVTGNFFSVLEVPAAVGRVFRPEETWASSSNVAVISYGFWQRQFAGDRADHRAHRSSERCRHRDRRNHAQGVCLPFAGRRSLDPGRMAGQRTLPDPLSGGPTGSGSWRDSSPVSRSSRLTPNSRAWSASSKSNIRRPTGSWAPT